MDQEEVANASSDPLGVSTDTSQTPTTPKLQDGKTSRNTIDSTSSNPGTPSSTPSTPVRMHSRHVFPPPSTPRDERSDAESDLDQNEKLDHMTREELVAMYKKHERTLGRYKTRFSEVCIKGVYYFL